MYEEDTEEYHKIPVTLVTGFLGSGKTTFIQRMLKEQHGLRIAVLQNEFSSEMGIEKPILNAGGASVFELPNGCLCCSLKDGIVDAVESILQFRCQFDWLVVEAAGNVDPLELASNFWLDPESPLVLDGVLSVTCPSVIQTVLRNSVDTPCQNSHYDGKANHDITSEVVEKCPTQVKHDEINRNTMSHKTADQRYKLLGKDIIDDHDMVKLMEKQLSVADVIILNKVDQINSQNYSDDIRADGDLPSLSAKNGMEQISSIFENFKSLLQEMNPTAKVLKTSFCNVDFNHVMNLKMFDAARIMTFKYENHKEHSHDHDHDSSQSNVFIKTAGVYSLQKVNDFVSHLLWESGTTVYRCKGIFRAVKDCPMITDADGKVAIFQLQGVGMIFEVSETEVLELEENRFLFIGQDIDRDTVKNGLEIPVVDTL
ncbi:COBW domain-containing protein 1 [Babesia sp. Xinjiang]|uniref:COBW domain-containing protein 1 n=1 Tax=Babesia sp. Xinjiang TaxID=462227 RepID=UPI000A255522|nr:COBW domain-containing protein 1 [Babesia sp. Xinjiang]ORM41173.1 COBW domain-containing protein 1 [Babesia sp. Xinjiang]